MTQTNDTNINHRCSMKSRSNTLQKPPASRKRPLPYRQHQHHQQQPRRIRCCSCKLLICFVLPLLTTLCLRWLWLASDILADANRSDNQRRHGRQRHYLWEITNTTNASSPSLEDVAPPSVSSIRRRSLPPTRQHQQQDQQCLE